MIIKRCAQSGLASGYDGQYVSFTMIFFKSQDQVASQMPLLSKSFSIKVFGEGVLKEWTTLNLHQHLFYFSLLRTISPFNCFAPRRLFVIRRVDLYMIYNLCYISDMIYSVNYTSILLHNSFA